jgi:hypothetical protein
MAKQNQHYSVEQLIELVTSPNKDDRIFATRTLANYAGSALEKKTILQCGGDAAFIDASNDARSIAMERSGTRGIANMTEKGSVPRTYKKNMSRFRSFTLATIHQLDPNERQEMTKGGAPALVSMSKCRIEKMRRHSARDMSYLAESLPSVRPRFQEYGGVPVIMSVAEKHPKDQAVLKHTARTLKNLAMSGFAEEATKQMDILPALALLSRNSDPVVARVAKLSRLLIQARVEQQTDPARLESEGNANGSQLAREYEQQLSMLVEHGAIEALVRLAGYQDLDVRSAAVRGLANLAQKERFAPRMFEAGAWEVLVRSSRAHDPEEAAQATRAVAYLRKEKQKVEGGEA